MEQESFSLDSGGYVFVQFIRFSYRFVSNIFFGGDAANRQVARQKPLFSLLLKLFYLLIITLSNRIKGISMALGNRDFFGS